MKVLSRAMVVLLLAGCAAQAVAAEGRSIAAYAGYREGGSFEDNAAGSVASSSASLSGDESFSASLELPLDQARQYQIFYSYQKSSLSLNNATIGIPSSKFELPLRISYLQIGGTNYFNGEVGRGGYVVGGLGATLFDPSGSDYNEELRFSLNVGLGYQLPLGKRLALRFEGRGYFTLINSSGGMFCNGGNCAIAVAGDSIVQGELMVGLAFGL